MGSGKTTLAKNINEILYNSNAVLGSFAGPIKEIYKNRELLLNFEIPINKSVLGVKSNEMVPLYNYEPFMNHLQKLDNELELGQKPRKHYQYIGDFFKKVYGPSFWADLLFKDFENMTPYFQVIQKEVPALIIDDLRMNVEYKKILTIKDKVIILCIEYNEDERLKLIEKNKLSSNDKTT
jgi:hypothetical protein